MGLSTVYSEIQELLVNFPSDIRDNIVSYLEEISEDTNDHRNILGLYEHDVTSDGVSDKLANDLIEKMTKLIKTFNVEMIRILDDTEKEYRTKIKRR